MSLICAWTFSEEEVASVCLCCYSDKQINKGCTQYLIINVPRMIKPGLLYFWRWLCWIWLKQIILLRSSNVTQLYHLQSFDVPWKLKPWQQWRLWTILCPWQNWAPLPVTAAPLWWCQARGGFHKALWDFLCIVSIWK